MGLWRQVGMRRVGAGVGEMTADQRIEALVNCVHQFDGISCADLVSKLGWNPNTVRKLIGECLQMGFLVRQKNTSDSSCRVLYFLG